jgi:two-component system, OmpR family, sensor kinase
MRLSFRPSTWPLQLKVPMLVAGLMIAVSIVLSHMVLRRLAQDQETHLHQLTGSYLDGLSTAVLPYVIRRDVWETFDILDRARDRYTGVKARYAVVALKDGSVLAASDPKQFPVGRPLPRQLAGHMGSTQELVLDEKQGLAWVSRVVRQENIDLGSIIAEIDISDLLRVRREVLLALILANGAVTLLFAAVGYALARRMVRPISLLTSYVDRVRDGAVLPIPHQHVADQATEFGRLFASFNDMAAALREREALTLRLAEEEKVAMLGKLASGMAHEVNNPLGGMLNLVDTLRKHGHDQQVRLRSLDLLERGLIGIRNVVRATLTTYKQDAPSSKLLRSELDDLQFLIQHEMSRHRASLRWTNVLPEQINVDGAAVRQIALNLLLNACAASPADGVVEVEACSDEESLMLIIRDQGPGLPANAIDYYGRSSFAEQPPPNVGLGIWTVCLLVSRLGGRIEVVSNRQDGTIIRVVLPLHGETRLAVA